LEPQRAFDPFRFLLIAVSGWMNQRQLQVIDYLREENRSFASNSAIGDRVSITISAGD
jgi:hypothetical protein